VLDSLKARNKLETDKAFLVSLNMLEKELVLGDVGIGKVELNLEVNIVMNSIFRADIYVYK